MMQYTKPQELTKANYYSALGKLNNNEAFLGIDIVTFSAFLDWEEKVAHYTGYYNQLVKEAA